ncbi:MAG: MBOAT family protein, partial [Campylobacterales bacterium]|nr:MBOAT family protein [Campylobacterales bacterium]
LIEAWVTSLSYTFQLYFDFSGYTDMAIGVALLFNIKLPINFNSPYKAKDIQDFWRRWHITLSRFLRDYIYIPLGGSRVGNFRIYSNLMITFIIGGLWHGAGWTFVFWGFLHGSALCIHRLWKSFGLKMNVYLAWFITFNFINISWVFFRAKEWDDAIYILKSMIGLNGIELSSKYSEKLSFLSEYGVTFGVWLENINGNKSGTWLLISLIIVLFTKNSMELKNIFKANILFFIISVCLFFYAVSSMHKLSEFLYFNF